ncbi:uncharacterized protein LOC144092582 isoform X1 [Stigmatopora argus]
MLRSADLSQDSPLESAAPPFRISIPSQFSPVTPFDGLFETGPPPTTPEGPIGEGADLAVRLVHEQVSEAVGEAVVEHVAHPVARVTLFHAAHHVEAFFPVLRHPPKHE